MAGQSPSSSQTSFHAPKGDFVWRVGADVSCDLHVPFPGIDPKHVTIKREGNRVFIHDLGSKAGTFVNGERLKGRHWSEISRYDDIKLGIQSFKVHPQVFFGGGLAGIESSELTYESKEKVVLCDGLYVSAKPETVTAIMGPSGSGKSVLLKLINGYNRPTSGCVMVGGQFDIHSASGSSAVRDYIGYVPQAEVMIPELTVGSSLFYRLRLRYPDIKRPFCERFIRQICSRLGFDSEDRLTTFLNKQIGSPESQGKVLSGGERRRANIAHEMVCRTQVLLLDEPTSGLSSVDADHIVKLLHDLAKQDGLTVITTVHQPSRDAFDLFDDLLLMGYGGKPAYYGPAKQATAYLEQVTGKRCGTKNPAEFVLEVLKEKADSDLLTQRFSQASTRPAYANKPMCTTNLGTPSIPMPTSVSKGSLLKRSTKFISSLYSGLSECKTLIYRNARVTVSDRINILFSIGQVPLIALLTFAAFHNIHSDSSSFDNFARRFFFFGQSLAEHESSGSGAFPAEARWREANDKAKNATNLISEPSAKARASIIFTLVVASLWFGLMGACKEIVTEHHILERESRSCVTLGPYVFAKMWIQLNMIAIQTGLLTMMVVPIMLRLSVLHVFLMWLVLWVAGISAAALGLLVSSIANTYRVALSAVPLLMIPQLLLGGLLRPIEMTKGISLWPRLLSYATIQRWAFEAGLFIDRFSDGDVLRQFINTNPVGKYTELKIIEFQEGTLVGSFFGEYGNTHLVFPLFILACATFFMLILCRIVLYKRLCRL